MSQELLQQIAVNTSRVKTNLVSIVTEEPEFSVEFPSPLQASEMALTQLRCYYSWPNVRAEPFGDKLPNNSFTFSYKKGTDGTPEWHTIYLPTGPYDIEDINEEIINGIEAITGKNTIVVKNDKDLSPIEIIGHEPFLSTTIEINSPDYAVDIYNSSIRTLLGWPENIPGTIDISNLPPEPQKSDFIFTNENYHGYSLSYFEGFIPDFIPSSFFKIIVDKKDQPVKYETAEIQSDNVTKQFTAIHNEFKRFKGLLENEFSTNPPNEVWKKYK